MIICAIFRKRFRCGSRYLNPEIFSRAKHFSPVVSFTILDMETTDNPSNYLLRLIVLIVLFM